MPNRYEVTHNKLSYVFPVEFVSRNTAIVPVLRSIGTIIHWQSCSTLSRCHQGGRRARRACLFTPSQQRNPNLWTSRHPPSLLCYCFSKRIRETYSPRQIKTPRIPLRLQVPSVQQRGHHGAVANMHQRPHRADLPGLHTLISSPDRKLDRNCTQKTLIRCYPHRFVKALRRSTCLIALAIYTKHTSLMSTGCDITHTRSSSFGPSSSHQEYPGEKDHTPPLGSTRDG